MGFRGIAPILPEMLVVAARLRMQAPRLGVQLRDDGTTRLVHGEVPVLADLVLSGEVRQVHLSWAVGVRNLFDWRYGSPGGDDLAQAFVPQQGRQLFVQTKLSF